MVPHDDDVVAAARHLHRMELRDRARRDEELLDELRELVVELARAAQVSGKTAGDASPEAIATLLDAVGDGLVLHSRLDPEPDAKGHSPRCACC